MVEKVKLTIELIKNPVALVDDVIHNYLKNKEEIEGLAKQRD